MEPPSSVRRMAPWLPTAIPVLASAKEMPDSRADVPLDMRFHVTPVSVVRKMEPWSPTAIMVLASSTATARRAFPVGCGFSEKIVFPQFFTDNPDSGVAEYQTR